MTSGICAPINNCDPLETSYLIRRAAVCDYCGGNNFDVSDTIPRSEKINVESQPQLYVAMSLECVGSHICDCRYCKKTQYGPCREKKYYKRIPELGGKPSILRPKETLEYWQEITKEEWEELK